MVIVMPMAVFGSVDVVDVLLKNRSLRMLEVNIVLGGSLFFYFKLDDNQSSWEDIVTR